MKFIFFILIFLSIYFYIHWYVYSRIVKGLELPPEVCNYVKIIFILGALSFITGELLSKRFQVYPLVYFGAIWLGIISISFSVFILKDIIGIFYPLKGRFVTLVTLDVIFLISIFSIYNASRGPQIKEIKLQIKKLPSELSGFSIVQLSDLHLGTLTSTEWLKSIVDKTNNLNPDLIVITGDLIDEDISQFREFCKILKNLKSRYGVFAVTGNHEFYAGLKNFEEIARRSDIRILRNEKITVADSIELAGIDDNTGQRFGQGSTDLEFAMKNVDLKKPVILLSHQPDIFEKAVKLGVDLQLSGHTHAGQIPPMDLLVMLYFKYPWGLHKKNSSYIYTSTGTGTWGPLMRTFSQSEIVKIVLTK